MAKKQQSNLPIKLLISAGILLALLIVSSIVALFFAVSDSSLLGNTAHIKIMGPIMADSAGGLFADPVVSSTGIVELLEKARDDSSITAVLLEINSPGGSAVASDEIAQAVEDVRAEGKPVVAWIREVGASGGYWIASSSDHIVANRMSITGSIGVISSYVGFDEFLSEWNLTYNRLVAGEHKDIGDPFARLGAQDRRFLEDKLETIHGFFIEEVARNRNMSVEDVRPLADGRFFLGIEAYEAGLIDEIGGKAEAIAYLEGRTGTKVELVPFEQEEGFFDALFGAKSPSGVSATSVPLAR